MALSNSQYNAIMRMYDRRQIENKHDQDARIRRVYEAVPALAEVQEELTASFAACAKCRLSGDETGAAVWRAKIEDLKEQRRVLLKSGGSSEDYINMRYQCPDCRDTGYRDGKKCHCFKQAEIELLYSQSGIHEKLNSENFEHFSLEYFDNTQVEPKSGKTAYEYMRQTVDFCWDYIERFGEEKGNILFTGKAGRGKTFLSRCIAKELMDRRGSVVYLSAVDMFDFLSKYKFDYDPSEEVQEMNQYILDCDLLIIDDLGTELINTFTTSQLFYLVNERMNRKKGTIISTNLPVNSLRDEFTDRVTSRIMSGYTIIPLYGEDIRIQKKLKGLD